MSLISSLIPILIQTAISIVIIWSVAFLLLLITSYIINKKLDPRYDSIDTQAQSHKVIDLYQTITQTCIVFFGCLLTCDALGINIGVLVAGLSLGMTFALQHTMKTVISALLLK